MSEPTVSVDVMSEDTLSKAAVEIFSSAKDVYFRESALLSAKRAELDTLEMRVATVRGQIAEREVQLPALHAHMMETFSFARTEIERATSSNA